MWELARSKKDGVGCTLRGVFVLSPAVGKWETHFFLLGVSLVTPFLRFVVRDEGHS